MKKVKRSWQQRQLMIDAKEMRSFRNQKLSDFAKSHLFIAQGQAPQNDQSQS